MKGLTSDAILYYIDNPVDFVEDIIGAKPDVNQKAILNSLAKYPMTSVRSGHGIGKSAVEAWAVIWFICTRPYPKIPCTAPTQHQLYDILWAEISKWLRSNPALQREITWTQERVYMNGAKEEWFAVARTANTPDALQESIQLNFPPNKYANDSDGWDIMEGVGKAILKQFAEAGAITDVDYDNDFLVDRDASYGDKTYFNVNLKPVDSAEKLFFTTHTR